MSTPPHMDVDKLESDQARDFYVWVQTAGGKTFTFATHVNRYCPYWCSVHSWATDHQPCRVCAGEETTMGSKRKTSSNATAETVRAPRNTGPLTVGAAFDKILKLNTDTALLLAKKRRALVERVPEGHQAILLEMLARVPTAESMGGLEDDEVEAEAAE